MINSRIYLQIVITQFIKCISHKSIVKILVSNILVITCLSMEKEIFKLWKNNIFKASIYF